MCLLRLGGWVLGGLVLVLILCWVGFCWWVGWCLMFCMCSDFVWVGGCFLFDGLLGLFVGWVCGFGL